MRVLTHTLTRTCRVFWGKIYGMEMSRLELAHINDFILYASTQLPGTEEVWDLRLKLMVSYQLVLRLPNTGLLSLGLKARLVAVGGGGSLSPYPRRLPGRHSKQWPSERSQCLSPLGPSEELCSHKY